MTIETKTYGIEIYADQDKAIKRKDDAEHTKSTVTSVCIPLSQDPTEWEDCEYGEDDPTPSPDDATEADKDAALRRLGVNI